MSGITLVNAVGKPFFCHESSIVETSRIGDRTHIWPFSHILSGATIGADCNIYHHTFIEGDVVIGDRVTIKCGVQVWNGVRLEDDVFIGPNVTFTNDPFLRNSQPSNLPHTVVRRGASLGANATILPGVVIGPRAMVGAGAVVTGNVPADAIIAGNPATIVGYVSSPPAAMPSSSTGTSPIISTEVRGVSLHRLPRVEDMRGALTVAEVQEHVPFLIQRFFLTYEVPTKEVRGEHAHRTLHQFLMCVHGSCCVIADDGANRREFRLSEPTTALYLPPLTWSVQYKHSSDAVLLVVASAPYDAQDYIRDYEEFREIVSRKMNDSPE